MSYGTKTSRMMCGSHFWTRGYCVSTVGLNEATIHEYIRNKEEEDKCQEKFNF